MCNNYAHLYTTLNRVYTRYMRGVQICRHTSRGPGKKQTNPFTFAVPCALDTAAAVLRALMGICQYQAFSARTRGLFVAHICARAPLNAIAA